MKSRLKNKNTNSYVCGNCGRRENIPIDVLEYFDELNPQQVIMGGHKFECEACDNGIMEAENIVKPIVRAYGLFEGINFE